MVVLVEFYYELKEVSHKIDRLKMSKLVKITAFQILLLVLFILSMSPTNSQARMLMSAFPGDHNGGGGSGGQGQSNGTGIVINELMANNDTAYQDECGGYQDWIEIYNNGTEMVNLFNYSIFDSNAFWVFPPVEITGHGYLIIWANDQECSREPLSAPFKLSSSGETVELRDTQGNIIDHINYPAAPSDHSFGRFPNGTGSFELMSTSTPLETNVSETLPPNDLAQYIKVNEVVTSNNNGIEDEDGDRPDWIELYNAHPYLPVNLLGLKISDSSNQWTFPDISIGSHDYLLLWASGKDRAGNELHTNFSISSTGEPISILNTDGITVEDMLNVPSIAPNNSYGRLPDGGINTQEFIIPTPRMANHETDVENNFYHSLIAINEIVTDNASGLMDFEGERQDWIELFNKSGLTIDLQGLRIKDNDRVWSFPHRNIEPGGYLVIFASSKNITDQEELHTNFSLSVNGEHLTLQHIDGTEIENVIVEPLPTDLSYGRDPDGSGSFRLFNVPTPGEMNRNVPPPDPNADADEIIINEIVSNNSSGIQDNDQDYSDWIEFYNRSTNIPVNMNGLKLLDSTDTWVFPNVVIEPQHYLIVFASGKNRTLGELHTNFSIASGAGGESLTYKNLDNSVISTVDIPQLQPNTSFARDLVTGLFRIFQTPTPAAANEEIVMEPNPLARLLTMNELAADWENSDFFADEDGDPSDWIEFFNTSDTETINFEGLKLRDATDVWTFPDRELPPQSYLIVFASSKDRVGNELHTNFRIESSGETIAFLNRDSTLIEQLILVPQESDHSIGRFPNGNGQYQFFSSTTPGRKNVIKDEMIVQADYIISTQYHQSGNNANGALNNIVGEPTQWVPVNNALSILALLETYSSTSNNVYWQAARDAVLNLLRNQDEEGGWADSYNYSSETNPTKSALNTASSIVAISKFGYDPTLYEDIVLAADYLLSLQNIQNKTGNDDGLICKGLASDGNYITDRWVLDNAWAYHAFVAAANWASNQNDIVKSIAYNTAAQNIIQGINSYMKNGDVWEAIIDANGNPKCNPDVPSQYCAFPTWMDYAPQIFDLPVNGLNDISVGEYIEDEFLHGSNGIIGFANSNGQLSSRLYPRHAFYALLSWQDIGSNRNITATLAWTNNTSLKNSTDGGWIDWFELSPNNGNTPQDSERIIDTSALAILFYSGYNFNFPAIEDNIAIVPDHFPTIESAIAAAADGWTIKVKPGTYNNGAIHFNGKNIHLVSEEGPEVTFINQSGADYTVYFDHNENRDAILEGFTILNPNFNGIKIIGSSPIIRHNIISVGENNPAQGEGIRVQNGINPLIENNKITDSLYGIKLLNIAPAYGVEIKNNIITNNQQTGIKIYSLGSDLIANNTITDNGWDGISASVNSGHTRIINNTIIGNGWDGIDCDQGPNLTVINNVIASNDQFGLDRWLCTINNSYNDVWNNAMGEYDNMTDGFGELQLDPNLVQQNDGRYVPISSNSSIVDQGDPDLDNDGIEYQNDIDDQDPDGTRLDIGAVHFNQSLSPQNHSCERTQCVEQYGQNYGN